jgi:hypothetical protein
MELRLRRTEIPACTPLDDDYCVVLDGQHTIGRIMQLSRAGSDEPGDAETLNEAKAAFRKRLDGRDVRPEYDCQR